MLDVSKKIDGFISKNREIFREKAIAANVEGVFLWETDSWAFGKSGYAWLKGANKGNLAFTNTSRIKGVEKMDVAPIYQDFMRAMLVETLIMSGNTTPAGAVFQQEILVMKRWYAELVKATGQSHPMYLTSDIIHAAMDTHAESGAASTAVSDYADKAVKLASVLSAKSLTLTTLNVQNQHPTRNTSVDVTELDPLKTEDEHLISIKAFMSIIELIYLAENDEDKVLLMSLLLLLITGLRFQELQNLKTDCLVRREITDPDKLQYAKEMGFPDYYLGIDYIGAKKAGKRIHWLAPTTYPVVEMIVERVTELTSKQRALLIYYRESDFTYLLPDAIRELPEDEVESRELVGHVFDGSGGVRSEISRRIQSSINSFAGCSPRVHEVHSQLKHYFYTKDQINDYIIGQYSKIANFEQGQRGVHTYNDNGTHLNFNYEELLFISSYGMGNLVNDFRHLSVITPLQENTLKKWLGNTQGSTSIFSLFGMTEDDGSEIRVAKHTPRHNINTFLAIAGVTDHLQAILMGRVDVTQNKHYQHGVESLEYRAAAMAMVALEKTFHAKKDVFTEDDQMSLFDTPVEHSPVEQGTDKSEVTQRMAAYAKANRTRTGVEAVKSTASMIVSKDLSTEANLKRAMQTYGASSEEMAKYVGDSMSESFMPELKEAHDKLINNKQEQEAKRLLERHARIYPLVFGACTRDVARFGCPFAMRCQEGLPCGYFTLSGRMGETEEVISRLERKQKEVETLRELVSTNPAFQLALDEQEQSLLLYEGLKSKALKSLQESEIVSLLSDDPQNPFAHILKTIREQDLVGKTPKTLADLFYIEQKRMERDAAKGIEDKKERTTMRKKRLAGKELDQYIQNELLMMIREGLEKSPIQPSTVHARLVLRGIIKGGLSTLSVPHRKKMIEEAKQRQHNTSEFTDEEHENFSKGRVSKAYVQKAERYKQELDEFKEKYERNVLAVADIVHYVDSVTPMKVEEVLGEYLVRELAMAKKNEGNDVMKKTPAEVNVEKLEAWIAKQTDQDIKELNYRGSINKGAVAAQSGVNKRAITGQNQRATKIF